MLTAAGERPSARDPVAARCNDGLPKRGKGATHDCERITAENLLRSGHRQVTGKCTQGTSDQLAPTSRAIDPRDRLDDPEKGHRINLRPAKRAVSRGGRDPLAPSASTNGRGSRRLRSPSSANTATCGARPSAATMNEVSRSSGIDPPAEMFFAIHQWMPFTPLLGDEVGPKSSEPIRKFPKARPGWRLASGAGKLEREEMFRPRDGNHPWTGQMWPTLSSSRAGFGLSSEVFSGSIRRETRNRLHSARVLSIYCGCSSRGKANFLPKT